MNDINKNLIADFRKHALECLATFKHQQAEEQELSGLVGEQYIFVDAGGLQSYMVSGSCSRPSNSFATATRFSLETAERIVSDIEYNRGHKLQIMKYNVALSCAIIILEEMIASYDTILANA